MKRRLLYIGLVVITLVISSCQKPSPYVYRGWPKEYTSAWMEDYGRCYDSVPLNVLALDLYSEGLEMDSTHHMKGTGYNLYISDIFMEDSTLAVGSYHSLRSRQPEPFTFIPGKDFEGYPNGIYLLQIENNTISGMQVFDSGQFVLRDTTNGLYDLKFTLYYTILAGSKPNRATYTTHFQGELQPWSKK